MVLSVSSMFFHDLALADIFSSAWRAGSDTLEFWLETPDFWVPGLDIDTLDSAISAGGRRPLAVHAPVLDLNPCSINPDIRAVSIEWIIRSIRIAEHIGASVCTIHPGRRTARRPPSETDYMRLHVMLDSIAPVAEKSNVLVSIENMEPQINTLLSTPRELDDLLNRWEWLYFTLDICHVSSQGSRVLSEYVQVGGDRIANIHLSGNKGGVLHRPVKNDPFATGALQLLEQSGYTGPVTIEIDDLVFPSPLSREEKIRILSEDNEYIREYIS